MLDSMRVRYSGSLFLIEFTCFSVAITFDPLHFFSPFVQVMADMTVCQSDTGEITSGLVTNSWTTRRVMKLNSGDR